MRIEIVREALLDGLRVVAGILPRGPVLPILSNVLLRSDGERLTLTATDMEVEITIDVRAERADAGACCLPGRKLLDIIKNLDAKAPVMIDMDFTDGASWAQLRTGRSRFRLIVSPAEDYPALNARTSEPIALGAAKLRTLLAHTTHAMAKGDVRYYLNGLLVHIQNGVLRTVATDGHRMAMDACEIQAGDRQIILPRKGVDILKGLLGTDDELTLLLGSNHFTAEMSGLKFSSKLVDGRYPDYGRVIPQDGIRVGFDRADLIGALSRASILTADNRGVRLEFSRHRLGISARSNECEQADEEVVCDYAGEDVAIGISVDYLMEALQAFESSRIGLYIAGHDKAVKIMSEGEQMAIVMPMRL